VAQVRELIDDVPLAPVRASSKVYILTDVGLLRGTAANALLKTIEEPPAGVMFILIARSSAQVLPTIASRCQQVPFRVIASDAAVRVVCERTGASESDARIALSVAGTPDKAAEFLASPDRRQLRRLVLRHMGELPSDDDWDVLQAAQAIVWEVWRGMGLVDGKGKRVPRDKAVKAQIDERIEGKEDYWSPAALRQLNDSVKRELTARERSRIIEVFATVSSLLRDVLVLLTGVEQTLVNVDAAQIVERLARTSGADGVLSALGAVSQATDDLAHNVSPQLTVEVMLLHIKEALTCPPSSR
jgi:DNA polymerase-3 subunit delta'